jgi:hypothetical protein
MLFDVELAGLDLPKIAAIAKSNMKAKSDP